MRATVLCLIGGCALLLVACGGSSPATVQTSPTLTDAPTTRPSAAPTTSAPQTGPLLTGHGVTPGETPPTRPPSSIPRTAAGALSFAAYFYKALDWSIATNNAYLAQQVSSPSCDACNTLINAIEQVGAAGGYSSGGRINASEFAIVTGHHLVDAQYVVQVTLTQSTQVLVTSTGAAASTNTPGGGKPATSFLYLGWGGSGWQALAIGRPA